MFTGIIKEVGRIRKISTKRSNLWGVGLYSEKVYSQVAEGGSLSVNGVCLTVTKKERNLLYFDITSATLNISNLKYLKIGDYVNLEPSLSLGDKLEGHFVLGHIDTTAKIKKFTKIKNTASLEIEVPSGFKKYLIPKGSVAVEGISLTIAEVKNNSFKVNIIPYTLENTNLKYKRIGSFLNIEFDYLGKVVLEKVSKLKD
ncbi:MAG: riboflavin synthase [Candidatus Omnitrophota bacterium]|nr:MAG: riboflavin synthase [Candidatus Omnitrophota bacterium]